MSIASSAIPALSMRDDDRFFELTLDLLCVASFSGYFLRLNPSWERVLGWTRAELMSRPYVEFIHPEDRDSTTAAAARVAGGARVIFFENRYRCADGSYRWLQWMAQPLVDQQFAYCCARDVTEAKEAARQLAAREAELRLAVTSEREAHEQLKKITAQLIQSEKLVALGQLVAGVAHEINNPLAFVTNNLAVLERDVAALRELLVRYQEVERGLAAGHAEAFASVRAYADEIDAPYTLANLEGLARRSRDGLKRIQQIVRDLREFARGSDRIWDEVSITEGIDSTLNILRLSATNKNVELRKEYDPTPPLRCCPAKINQVVFNLVSNAIDACDAGGVVTVRTRTSGTSLEIQVIDNGSGIDPKVLDRIFNPFFTTKPPGQGTGLGLSIVHGIVTDHQGTIDVHSAPGQGTRFTVMLPLTPRSDAAAPSLASDG